MLDYVLLSSDFVLVMFCYLFVERSILKKKIPFFVLVVGMLLIMFFSLSYSVVSNFFLLFFLFGLSTFIHRERAIGHTLLNVLLVLTVPLTVEPIAGKVYYYLLVDLSDPGQRMMLIVLYELFVIGWGIFLLTAFARWGLPFLLKRGWTHKISYALAVGWLAFQSRYLMIYVSTAPEGWRFQLLTVILAILLSLFIIIGGTTLYFMKKSQQLQMEKMTEQIKYEAMHTYTTALDAQYQEIRKFRHDYLNILATLENYLDEAGDTALNDYFYRTIQPTKKLFLNHLAHLNDLKRIQSVEIRSLITQKIILAQEKKFEVCLEICEDVLAIAPSNLLGLVRILGVFLDNALEELDHLPDGRLKMAIFTIEGAEVIIIENTARSNIAPVYRLRETGFTTKGGDRGLGLSIVTELLQKSPDLLLETTTDRGFFTQKLTILKED